MPKLPEGRALRPQLIDYGEIDRLLGEILLLKDKISQEDRRIIEYIRRIEGVLADLPFLPDDIDEISFVGGQHDEDAYFIHDDEYEEDSIWFLLQKDSKKPKGGAGRGSGVWRIGFHHSSLAEKYTPFVELPMPIVRRYAPCLPGYLNYIIDKINSSIK